MAISEDIKSKIKQYEYQYNMPEGLLYGLVLAESSGNPNARSSLDARGLTQIIPKYHPGLNNYYDPDENLNYAAKTLSKYAEQFDSWAAAVAAWHAGPGRVKKSLATGGDGIPGTKDIGTGLSTRDYVNKILKYADLEYKQSANEKGEEIKPRDFNRFNLGVIGLALVLLGAFVIYN